MENHGTNSPVLAELPDSTFSIHPRPTPVQGRHPTPDIDAISAFGPRFASYIPRKPRHKTRYGYPARSSQKRQTIPKCSQHLRSHFPGSTPTLCVHHHADASFPTIRARMDQQICSSQHLYYLVSLIFIYRPGRARCSSD
jgi:hypothetical protein